MSQCYGSITGERFEHGSDHAPVAARLELDLLRPINNQHPHPMYDHHHLGLGWFGCAIQ